MEKGSGEEERGLVRNEPQLTLIEGRRIARSFLRRGPSIQSCPAWVPLGYLGAGCWADIIFEELPAPELIVLGIRVGQTSSFFS